MRFGIVTDIKKPPEGGFCFMVGLAGLMLEAVGLAGLMFLRNIQARCGILLRIPDAMMAREARNAFKPTSSVLIRPT